MIRKMRSADADLVAEIWLEANLQAHAFLPAGYWTAHFDEVKEMIPQAETYVYESEDGVQGFAGLDGSCIAGIFVRKASQSNGIGRQLLDEAKHRKSRLTLRVYRKNQRAVQFYRREGFAIRGEGVDEATGEEEMTMEWVRKS